MREVLIQEGESMLTTIGLLLLAFTLGLVLEPFIARSIKKHRELRHSRKVSKAIVLLEAQGYTLKWTPKDVSSWGWVEPTDAPRDLYTVDTKAGSASVSDVWGV